MGTYFPDAHNLNLPFGRHSAASPSLSLLPDLEPSFDLDHRAKRGGYSDESAGMDDGVGIFPYHSSQSMGSYSQVFLLLFTCGIQ